MWYDWTIHPLIWSLERKKNEVIVWKELFGIDGFNDIIIFSYFFYLIVEKIQKKKKEKKKNFEIVVFIVNEL